LAERWARVARNLKHTTLSWWVSGRSCAGESSRSRLLRRAISQHGLRQARRAFRSRSSPTRLRLSLVLSAIRGALRDSQPSLRPWRFRDPRSASLALCCRLSTWANRGRLHGRRFSLHRWSSRSARLEHRAARTMTGGSPRCRMPPGSQPTPLLTEGVQPTPHRWPTAASWTAGYFDRTSLVTADGYRLSWYRPGVGPAAGSCSRSIRRPSAANRGAVSYLGSRRRDRHGGARDPPRASAASTAWATTSARCRRVTWNGGNGQQSDRGSKSTLHDCRAITPRPALHGEMGNVFG
jgi:hypothetical protein